MSEKLTGVAFTGRPPREIMRVEDYPLAPTGATLRRAQQRAGIRGPDKGSEEFMHGYREPN